MAQPMLDSESISRVGRLELIAKQAVEGMLSGKHRSPHHGSSVEYADHRQYAFGDEIKNIDWKLWAKTDRYFIKLFKDRTNLRCTLVLDTSQSMGFPPRPRNSPTHGSGTKSKRSWFGKRSTAASTDTDELSKLEYAGQLAACIGYLMLRQNDAVGLATFREQVEGYVPARSTARHLHLLLEKIAEAKPDQPTGIGPVLHELAGRMKRRGLVVLLSDLLDDEEAIASGLAHLKHNRHEVIVFQTLHPIELDLPLEKVARFRDMETGQEVVGDPRSLRDTYQQKMAEFIDRCKTICYERKVQHELVPTSTPPADLLASYLKRRASVASRLA